MKCIEELSWRRLHIDNENQHKGKVDEMNEMNEKERYMQQARARMDRWQAEIDELKARIAEADADARIDMHKHASKLQEKVDEAKARMHELSAASGEAWGDLKTGADLAWDSVKMAFEDAAKRFKHK